MKNSSLKRPFSLEINARKFDSSEVVFSSPYNTSRTTYKNRTHTFSPRVLRTRTIHSTNNPDVADQVIGVWKLKNPVHAGQYLSRLLFFRNGSGVDNFYRIDENEKTYILCSKEFSWRRISSDTYKINEEKGIICFPNPDTMVIDNNKEEFIRVR